MEKLILRLFCFLPLFLLVVGINFLVDPANLFHDNHYVAQLAGYLLQKKNVKNTTDYDERLLEQAYVSAMEEKKEIVVFGSSRSMQIRSTVFPNRRFYNSSVSGATLDDFFALYQLFYEYHKLPATILVGLDPWILNKHNGQTAWQSLAALREASRKRVVPHRDDSSRMLSYEMQQRAEKLFQLVSFSYFQSSLQRLIDVYIMHTKFQAIEPTMESSGSTEIRLYDGSLVYGKNLTQRSRGDVEKGIQVYLQEKPIYSLGEYQELDAGLKDEFEHFIQLAKKDQVKLLFFLPPYYPSVYDDLHNSSEYKVIDAAEQYFYQTAKKERIPIVGSYNPHEMGFTEADFYDAMHPKDTSLSEYLRINLHLQ